MRTQGLTARRDAPAAAPTPETDALYAKHHPAQAMPDLNQSYLTFVNFARKLERERDDARKKRQITYEANCLIREEQKEDFERAKKAEFALADATKAHKRKEERFQSALAEEKAAFHIERQAHKDALDKLAGRDAEITRLWKDAERYQTCARLGFPVRVQSPSRDALRWTINGVHFGATPTDCIDSAIDAEKEHD
jgi:hypothetical protein